MSVEPDSDKPKLISESPIIYSISGFNDVIHPSLEQKLVTREQLGLLGDFLRERHKKIAFTTGTYDMIHIGHGRYLALARSLGDVLVLGLNSDSSVKQYKGPSRPILEERKREEMLAFLSSIDFITPYDEVTGAETIRILRPDAYLCVEGSWPEGTELKDKDEVKAMALHNGKTYCTPRQAPFLSTSTIIEKLMCDGEAGLAQEIIAMLETRLKKAFQGSI